MTTRTVSQKAMVVQAVEEMGIRAGHPKRGYMTGRTIRAMKRRFLPAGATQQLLHRSARQ